MNDKKFVFEWANGSEIVIGKNYIMACQNIKTKPIKILTGFLVRIYETDWNKPAKNRKKAVWKYWDAEQFWKNLKKSKGLKKR